MSHLTRLDWAIIVAFIALSIGIGVVLSRRGRKSVREYFTSGGTTSWWLLGTSMVATTFASDTPLTLAGWVVTKGIAQNWFWWCQIPVTMLGVFFIACLWQRSRLVTDIELVDLRYGGTSAAVLRGFKALYLSLVYGCIVMGWVNLAMTKIIQLTLPDIPRVAVVDEAMLWAYLHTPLSRELSPEVKKAIRSGDVDPLKLYYDNWTLHRSPKRVAVFENIGLVFTRLAAIKRKPASSAADDNAAERQRWDSYIAGIRSEPFLSDLGLVDRRAASLASLSQSIAATEQPIAGSERPDSPLRELRVLYDVNQTVSAVNKFKIIILLFLIVMAYTVISGLWGVLVTDFVQFWIAMAGCIVLAILAVQRLGGLDAVLRQMADIYTTQKARGMVGMIPVAGAGDLDLMPWSHFLVFLLFMWYVSGLTDGGSYFAQRMLAAKDERHAAMGYLWFSVAHYCLRMWPWIIVGFVAAVMFPYVPDAITGQYPGGAVAENGYIKVMLAVLPSGWMGMMLAAFLAAYMSTIATQLNLGASYLLNDFYRPFIRKQASDRHYVAASQVATVVMAAVGLIVSLFYDTISDAWFLIGTLSAGIGLIHLLRWFWWRVNAWTEISCLGSLLLFVVVVRPLGPFLPAALKAVLLPPYPLNLLLLVPYSVGIALIVTCITAPVSMDKLTAFVRRVQPGGPGWRRVEAEIRRTDPTFRSRTPLTRANLWRCLGGCVATYCFLFGGGMVVIGDVYVPDAWVPRRLLGGLLIGAGVLVGWFVVRSLSQRRWGQATE